MPENDEGISTPEEQEMWDRITKRPRSAAPSASQRSEVGSTDGMGVGAEATRLIVEGMLCEALRWQSFAAGNNLKEKEIYFKGRAEALDELRRFTKALAPSPIGGGERQIPAR